MSGAKCAAAWSGTLGIRVLTGKALEKIAADARGARGTFGAETLEAELLLGAVGRKPVTDGLKLDKAGLATNERGFIEADDYCRTYVATIYAIGNVTGKTSSPTSPPPRASAPQKTPWPEAAQARRTGAERHLYLARSRHRRLERRDAKKQNRAVKTGKFRFAGLGKALATGETTGFVKWIADAATDQLLGAAAVGPHATELIAEAATAIRAELTVKELARPSTRIRPSANPGWKLRILFTASASTDRRSGRSNTDLWFGLFETAVCARFAAGSSFSANRATTPDTSSAAVMRIPHVIFRKYR